MDTQDYTTDSIEWKPIPGYEGYYEVSNTGLVKSVITRKGSKYGHILKPGLSGGYPIVELSIDKQGVSFRVHLLVMRAFVGAANGQIVNHINGNREDNRLKNLEYVTYQENTIHARDVLETFPQGEKHYHAKFTESDVKRIRELALTGMRFSQIGRMYGSAGSVISLIVKRKSWKHVK